MADRPPGLYDVAPGQRDETTVLLAMLDSTSAFWKRELRGLKHEELRWTAREGAHSIGTVLLHIAIVEHWWIHVVAMGRPEDKGIAARCLNDETDQGRGVWPAPPNKPKAWFFKQCADVRAATYGELQGLDATKHRGRYGKREFTLRWILHHLIEHEAYHAGQMLLLRDLYRRPRR